MLIFGSYRENKDLISAFWLSSALSNMDRAVATALKAPVLMTGPLIDLGPYNGGQAFFVRPLLISGSRSESMGMYVVL